MDVSSWNKRRLVDWLRERRFMATMAETRATLRGYVAAVLEAEAELEREITEHEDSLPVPLADLRARWRAS